MEEVIILKVCFITRIGELLQVQGMVETIEKKKTKKQSDPPKSKRYFKETLKLYCDVRFSYENNSRRPTDR